MQASQYSQLLKTAREEGLRDGGLNKPDVTAAGLSQNEMNSRAAFLSELRDREEAFQQEVTAYRQLLGRLEAEWNELLAKATLLRTETSDRVRARILADLSMIRDSLVPAETAFLSISARLKYFRAQRNLEADRAYVRVSTLKEIGLILVAIIVESSLNMFFFSKGQELGLLGGFMMAGLISVANAAMGLGAGFGYRYKNTLENPTRRAGLAILPVYVLVVLLFNLTVAGMRVLAEQGLDPSSPSAFLDSGKSILGGTFPLRSLESTLLFFIGTAISAFSFRTGYFRLEDRFPGHSELQTEFDEAEAERKVQRNNAFSVADAAVKKLLAELRGIRDQAVSKHMAVVHALPQSDLLFDQVIRDLEQIELNFSTAVSEYREANKSVRAHDLPKYFSMPLERLCGPSISFAESEQRKISEKLKAVHESSKAFHQEITESFTKQEQDINEFFRNWKEKEWQAWLDEVSKDAQTAAILKENR